VARIPARERAAMVRALHALGDAAGELADAAWFTGAGYRVPLAAVVFVAETTGRPGFTLPGLLAAVAAALVMGRASVTTYRRNTTAPAPEPPSCE
jgi:H+/Cl- antiporter ClcA